MNPIDRIEQLQAELARVTAELADELKCKEREQRDFSAICSDRNALRARVSELETALRKCQSFLNEWRDCLAGVQMTEADFDNTSGLLEARSALARAESAAPVKHPDTVRLDWLASNKQSGGKAFCLQWTFRDNNNQTNIRDAIDAARKLGGAK